MLNGSFFLFSSLLSLSPSPLWHYENFGSNQVGERKKAKIFLNIGENILYLNSDEMKRERKRAAKCNDKPKELDFACEFGVKSKPNHFAKWKSRNSSRAKREEKCNWKIAKRRH